MTSVGSAPSGLSTRDPSPVAGLHILERRVEYPIATVICVHGGLDRGGSFARVARRFLNKDVVAYDRRGYQGSRSTGPISLQNDIDDLRTVIGAEQPATPVIVLGHSYGGVVALGAALAAPDALDRLVMFETPLPWILDRPGAHRDLGDDPALEAERFFRRVVSDGAWERLSSAEKRSRQMDGPALLNDLRTLRGPAPFDLTRLAVPLWYGYSDGDRAPFYRELVDEMRRRGSDVHDVMLRGSGHGAHLSKPDQLAALIDSSWGAP